MVQPVLDFALPGFRTDTVSLEIDGMLYEGWLSAEVTRSVKEMAGQFCLDVAERTSPGAATAVSAFRIREGDACVVRYGGAPVLTGYVDVYSPKFDQGSHKVKVQGRSRTQDFVDSSAETEVDGGEMRDTQLVQMARRLARPHGITVKTVGRIDDRFDVARVVPGETKHEMLERYARPGAVALTDDADGALRLMRVEDGAAVAHLIEGVNITRGAATHRADNRYSDYAVKGQDHGDDTRYGRDVSEIEAKVKDGAVRRYRPFTLLNETKSTRDHARRRCAWECATRAGESVRAEVEVVGWMYAAGRLWMPGDRVHLTSAMLRVDRVLVVETVRLKQYGNGTLADLSLVPVEALNPDKATGRQSGSGGEDGLTTPNNDASWIATKPTRSVA